MDCEPGRSDRAVPESGYHANSNILHHSPHNTSKYPYLLLNSFSVLFFILTKPDSVILSPLIISQELFQCLFPASHGIWEEIFWIISFPSHSNRHVIIFKATQRSNHYCNGFFQAEWHRTLTHNNTVFVKAFSSIFPLRQLRLRSWSLKIIEMNFRRLYVPYRAMESTFHKNQPEPLSLHAFKNSKIIPDSTGFKPV